MAKQPVELVFPVGGVNRSVSFQKTPPFSCYDARNVRTKSAIGERVRGGSRAMLVKAFSEQLGGGNPIRCLTTYQPINPSPETYWQDTFDGSTVNSRWLFAGTTGVTITGGQFTTTGDNELLQPFPLLGNAAATYTIHMGGNGDATKNGVYSIYAAYFYGGSANFVQFKVTHTSGAWELVKWVAGASTTLSSGTATLGNTFTQSLVWNGTSTWQPKINGSNVGTAQTYATPYAAGMWGMNITTPSGTAYVNDISLSSSNLTDTQNVRRKVFASANGKSYFESIPGHMEELRLSGSFSSASGSSVFGAYEKLGSDQYLMAVEFFGKVYIADFSPTKISNGTSGGGTVTTNVLDDTSNAINWTNYGIDLQRDVCVIANHSVGTVETGTFQVDVVGSGGITITYRGTGTVADGTCTYRVITGPKIFDPATRSLYRMTGTYSSVGYVPVGCPLLMRFGGCLYWGGADWDPHNWRKSRNGDPLDYDETGDPGDTGRPLSGNNAAIGTIGSALTAFLAVGDDYAIMACENETYILTGNPAGNGRIQHASRSLGVIYRAAICNGISGDAYALSRFGLTRISYSGVELLSKNRIPKELVGINTATIEPIVSYDQNEHGIKIYLRPRDGSAGTHWFYDIANDAYWPDSYAVNNQATVATSADTVGVDGLALIIGGQNGYIRRYSFDATDDDGSAVTSYVLIGPLMLGGVGSNGILTSLQGQFDSTGGSVDWSVYTGSSAQAAVISASALHTGSFAAGLTPANYPRSRGYAAAIKLSSTARWALESLWVSREAGGMARP